MSLYCGYRFFECSECGEKWKEKCRDAETESGSGCPECYSFQWPVKNEKHPEWKTDAWGNLAEPNLYEGPEKWDDLQEFLDKENNGQTTK